MRAALFLTAAIFFTAQPQPGPAEAAPSPGRFVVSACIATCFDGGTTDLAIVTRRGKVRRLTRGPGYDSDPAWNPRRDLIAFVCGRSICTIRADGTGRRVVLAPDPGHFLLSPAWSPDGSSLAYVDGTSDPYNYGIYRMRRDGSERTLLVDGEPAKTELDWSPDGKFIAYAEQDPATSNNDIMTIPAAGGQPFTVAATDADELDPDWASDSFHLVYYRTDDLWTEALYADEGEPLVTSPDHDADPVWGPRDGSVFFLRGLRELMRVDADGTSVTRIARHNWEVVDLDIRPPRS